ncbi:hypothetical protein [Streptomyces milbemycinicus]|uniref:HTH cro/C1-type domain-containing protein n=1 Tax=Streptomyces milbemycinicus TaxID=476552 RepID=A0ABW8LED4_9ACTN
MSSTESGLPGFAVLLARLMESRRLNLQTLSQRAQFPEPELLAVAEGEVPSPTLLRRLAPALGLHTADLFQIAEVPLPDDLFPLDPGARAWIPQLVSHAAALSPEHRLRLRRLAQSLPDEAREHPAPTLPAYQQYEPSFGALFVRLLGNRNLDWTTSAKVLLAMTGLYLSASTIGAVGHGRRELTPELLTGFGTVLGIPTNDLAALTGIKLPAGKPELALADLAELLWDVRRLTGDQVRQMSKAARFLGQ